MAWPDELDVGVPAREYNALQRLCDVYAEQLLELALWWTPYTGRLREQGHVGPMGAHGEFTHVTVVSTLPMRVPPVCLFTGEVQTPWGRRSYTAEVRVMTVER